MKDKLAAIRRKGPESAAEFDPAIEMDLEEDMGMEDELGVEGEMPAAGGVEEIIVMFDGLSPEELTELRDELDMRIGEGGSEEMGMEFEMEEDEEEDPEMMA